MNQKHKTTIVKRRPWLVQRIINDWFNRLLGAASDRSFSNQAELYEANSTKRDYVWNTLGLSLWGMMFPLATIVATQLVGTEKAGMFSLAFAVGFLLMFVANFGVRTFQVSDLEETHSFADYQINRLATCAIMLIIGFLYCALRGYSEEMFSISIGVYVYKMIDGLADVYEGRLQQVGKLYLSGISLAVRSFLAVAIFSLSLLITRNLAFACWAMAIVAIISFFIVTLPLALLESPKTQKANLSLVRDLFIQCFPLFLAFFMFNAIDAMPKFVMEGMLDYDNQLYFNAMYFPAQAILIAVQFIYRPQLVRMANLWAEKAERKKFDLMIAIIVVGIIVLTLLTAGFMGWIGISLLSFLYGIDFEAFRGLIFIMVITGGVTAGIDFIYQVITVLRKQRSVTKLYFITFGFSLFVPVLLIQYAALEGVVLSYLIIMCILLVLLISDYLSIRLGFVQEASAESSLERESRHTQWRDRKERAERQRARRERLERSKNSESNDEEDEQD